MAVLVTGGAGYIGSHMVLALLDAGEEVVVIDDLSTGFAGAVPPEARLVEGVVADRRLVERLAREHRLDAIVHFAAATVVPESVADPLRYYRNNAGGTCALLEAAVRCGIGRFILSSTAAVYGTPETNPVGEDAPLRPMSPYGRSKAMAEAMLADAAAAHGLSTMALRYFNVAGADPHGRAGQSTRAATHLIKVACEAALGKRDRMAVFGTDYPTPDGTCIRDYIHVSDLVQAHLDALRHLEAGGESLVLNCGYGRGYSVLEIVAAVKRISGRDFAVRLEGRRAGDPVAVVAGAERIRRELGWRPRYDDLDIVVETALAWEAGLADRNLARRPALSPA
ncbi:MAG TPA: UDP-glucose 4-epimerase GalE [Afifellaceae bacterium]|nr:UDP-glucose 4-epimerase GalE [Afifellaceae bacterium]